MAMRKRRWWGFLSRDAEVPPPLAPTRAEENYRRRFLEQVAGTVLVAGSGAAAAHKRNAGIPLPPKVDDVSLWTTMNRYPSSANFYPSSSLVWATSSIGSMANYAGESEPYLASAKRGVRRG